MFKHDLKSGSQQEPKGLAAAVKPVRSRAQDNPAGLGAPVADKLARLQTSANASLLVQRMATVQHAAGNTSREGRGRLPLALRNGIARLSGMALDDVKVHSNSPKPSQVNAHAYAKGRDIYLAPGQEKHLPHEAWHVVQQAQGRVKPTLQLKGNAINTDGGLEAEADAMGRRALALGRAYPANGETVEHTGTESVMQAKSTDEAHAKACGCPACAGSAMVRAVPSAPVHPGGVIQRKCGQCDDPTCTGNPCKTQAAQKRDAQADRGLYQSAAFEQLGIEVGRNPHNAGGVATAGSSRAETHDHGNALAIRAAKNKAIQSGQATAMDFQSSQVRQRAAEEKKKERMADKDAARDGLDREEDPGVRAAEKEAAQKAQAAREAEQRRSEAEKAAEKERKRQARERRAREAEAERQRAAEFANTPAGQYQLAKQKAKGKNPVRKGKK